MSKIVVGMKSNPEIKPHKIDCGFLKTTPNAEVVLANQLATCAGASSLGRNISKTAPSTMPATPMPTHHAFQVTPAAIIGPTTNWPAEPPAIPNICVAPINVAATEAGKFFVAM